VEHVGQTLRRLTESGSEPVSDDAREAIRDGLSRAQEAPGIDEDEPGGPEGLPLGWEGVEPVL
jgi:hypothetical protein